mmetsp:Transcript_16540/g.23138  ORF Transcript_16540/g.23138 Transcript_16540/m.23138 type:complete len:875 (-) Transcript_16540:153-2777(-)
MGLVRSLHRTGVISASASKILTQLKNSDTKCNINEHGNGANPLDYLGTLGVNFQAVYETESALHSVTAVISRTCNFVVSGIRGERGGVNVGDYCSKSCTSSSKTCCSGGSSHNVRREDHPQAGGSGSQGLITETGRLLENAYETLCDFGCCIFASLNSPPLETKGKQLSRLFGLLAKLRAIGTHVNTPSPIREQAETALMLVRALLLQGVSIVGQLSPFLRLFPQLFHKTLPLVVGSLQLTEFCPTHPMRVSQDHVSAPNLVKLAREAARGARESNPYKAVLSLASYERLVGEVYRFYAYGCSRPDGARGRDEGGGRGLRYDEVLSVGEEMQRGRLTFTITGASFLLLTESLGILAGVVGGTASEDASGRMKLGEDPRLSLPPAIWAIIRPPLQRISKLLECLRKRRLHSETNRDQVATLMTCIGDMLLTLRSALLHTKITQNPSSSRDPNPNSRLVICPNVPIVKVLHLSWNSVIVKVLDFLSYHRPYAARVSLHAAVHNSLSQSVASLFSAALACARNQVRDSPCPSGVSLTSEFADKISEYVEKEFETIICRRDHGGEEESKGTSDQGGRMIDLLAGAVPLTNSDRVPKCLKCLTAHLFHHRLGIPVSSLSPSLRFLNPCTPGLGSGFSSKGQHKRTLGSTDQESAMERDRNGIGRVSISHGFDLDPALACKWIALVDGYVRHHVCQGGKRQHEVGLLCINAVLHYGLRTHERRAGCRGLSFFLGLFRDAGETPHDPKEKKHNQNKPPEPQANLDAKAREWIRRWLVEGNGGHHATLRLLLAANGHMPSFQLRSVVDVLFQLANLAGPKLFAQWLGSALEVWDTYYMVKGDVKKDFHTEMVNVLANGRGISAFKTLVKRFCGGKKKNERWR